MSHHRIRLSRTTTLLICCLALLTGCRALRLGFATPVPASTYTHPYVIARNLPDLGEVSGRASKWPCRVVFLEAEETGRVTGEIEWTTLATRTRFSGRLTEEGDGYHLRFRETSYVSGRGADLGATYDLRLARAGHELVFTGDWSLRRRGGSARIELGPVLIPDDPSFVLGEDRTEVPATASADAGSLPEVGRFTTGPVTFEVLDEYREDTYQLDEARNHEARSAGRSLTEGALVFSFYGDQAPMARPGTAMGYGFARYRGQGSTAWGQVAYLGNERLVTQGAIDIAGYGQAQYVCTEGSVHGYRRKLHLLVLILVSPDGGQYNFSMSFLEGDGKSIGQLIADVTDTVRIDDGWSVPPLSIEQTPIALPLPTVREGRPHSFGPAHRVMLRFLEGQGRTPESFVSHGLDVASGLAWIDGRTGEDGTATVVLPRGEYLALPETDRAALIAALIERPALAFPDESEPSVFGARLRFAESRDGEEQELSTELLFPEPVLAWSAARVAAMEAGRLADWVAQFAGADGP